MTSTLTRRPTDQIVDGLIIEFTDTVDGQYVTTGIGPTSQLQITHTDLDLDVAIRTVLIEAVDTSGDAPSTLAGAWVHIDTGTGATTIDLDHSRAKHTNAADEVTLRATSTITEYANQFAAVLRDETQLDAAAQGTKEGASAKTAA